MEAVKAWKKRSTAPTRAAAARELADDPDPRTDQALVKAAADKDWVVRAAALEAIAKRGDPALLPDITSSLSDKKETVRFSAAAVVLHLTLIIEEKRSQDNSASFATRGAAFFHDEGKNGRDHERTHDAE